MTFCSQQCACITRVDITGFPQNLQFGIFLSFLSSHLIRRRRRRAAGLFFAGGAGCGILSAPGFPFSVSALLSASLFRDIPDTAPVQGPHLCSRKLDISRALCTTHISSRPVSPPSPHSAFFRACDRRAIGAAALRWGQMAPAIFSVLRARQGTHRGDPGIQIESLCRRAYGSADPISRRPPYPICRTEKQSV